MWYWNSYNWLCWYWLVALKEFAFMVVFSETLSRCLFVSYLALRRLMLAAEFPVSKAVDGNRDCVVVSVVQGYPL